MVNLLCHSCLLDKNRDLAVFKMVSSHSLDLPANTEGTKLSQEEHSTLPLLVDDCTVASPAQAVVRVNSKGCILFHYLIFFSHDGNSVGSPFVLFTFKVARHVTKRSSSSLNTASCPSLMHSKEKHIFTLVCFF